MGKGARRSPSAPPQVPSHDSRRSSSWWSARMVGAFGALAIAALVGFARLGALAPEAVEDKWGHLENWVLSNGGYVHPSLKLGTTLHGGFQVRGLVVEKAVPENTLLIRIPQKVWLEQDSFPALAAFEQQQQQANQACALLQGSDMRLLTGLALEMQKGRASSYSPMFDLYPAMDDFRAFHPYLAGPSVRGNFSELAIFRLLFEGNRAKVELLKACFASWKEANPNPVSSLTFDDILFARFISETRSAGSAHHLIPIMDLCNTATQERWNAKHIQKANSVELMTSRKLAAGDEVFLRYCESCDNEALLARWGVYLEDNSQALNNLGKPDCSTDIAVEGKRRISRDSLGDVTRAILDSAPHSIIEQASPRCKDTGVEFGDQWPMFCSLARLAWETCAQSWGIEKRFLQDKADASNVSRDLHTLARSDMGFLFLSQRQTEKAARHLKIAVQISPDHIHNRYNLGTVLMQLGDVGNAKRNFQAVLELDDGHAHALTNLGNVEFQQGNIRSAASHLKAAAKLLPNDVRIHFNVAIVLGKLGDAAGAVQSYKVVLKLNPRIPEANYNMAQQLKLQGDTAGVMRGLKSELQINPRHAAARSELEELQNDQRGNIGN